MDLYSTFIVDSHSSRSGMDHTVLSANYTIFASKVFTRWRHHWLRWQTFNCGLLLICRPPKGLKSEFAWLADLQRTVYPHKWSPVSRRSSAGQRKFASQRPTFYHCATQPINPVPQCNIDQQQHTLYSCLTRPL